MSQRIVRHAGIAGITVAGLLWTGSGVASATVPPVLASGSTTTSITTTAYGGGNDEGDGLTDGCGYSRILLRPPPRLPLEPPYIDLRLHVGSRDFCQAANPYLIWTRVAPVHLAPGDPIPGLGVLGSDPARLPDRDKGGR